MFAQGPKRAVEPCLVVGLHRDRFAAVAGGCLTIYRWDEPGLCWRMELTLMQGRGPIAIAEEVRRLLRGHQH